MHGTYQVTSPQHIHQGNVAVSTYTQCAAQQERQVQNITNDGYRQTLVCEHSWAFHMIQLRYARRYQNCRKTAQYSAAIIISEAFAAVKACRSLRPQCTTNMDFEGLIFAG